MSAEEKNLIEILKEGHKVDVVKYIDHLADGLDVCKFLIDELKASVPIWKKEVYTNGEIWKENSEFMEKRLELVEKRDSLVKKPVTEEHRRGCCGSKVKVDEDEEHKDNAGDNKFSS